MSVDVKTGFLKPTLRNLILFFCMASNVEQIMTLLKTLTLMEATELVEDMQTVFKVDASAPAAVGAGVAQQAAPEEAEKAEEKTAFDVTVEDVPSDKRVAVLKVIRKLTDLGLADAKAFTTSLPKALKEGVNKEDAENAKSELEAAGAVVSIG